MNISDCLENVKTSWIDLILNYNIKNDKFIDNFNIISNHLDTLYQNKIYPNKENIFECFKYFNLQDTKCVLLGQDPYINEETINNITIPQAMGLSFSVNQYVKIPPSLKNIFIELKSDIAIEIPKNGNLTNWAKNNVLLLNSALTVEPKKSGSHLKIWEHFTDYIIKTISNECNNVVFILLGNFAKSKAKYIDKKKHCIIESIHPSPLSARNGFFGSKIFSKTNNYLLQNNIQEIDWTI